MNVPVCVKIGNCVVNLAHITHVMCEYAPLGLQGELVPAAFVYLSNGRDIVVTGDEARRVERMADAMLVDEADLPHLNDAYATGDGFIPSTEDIERLSGSGQWDDDTPL